MHAVAVNPTDATFRAGGRAEAGFRSGDPFRDKCYRYWRAFRS